MPFAFCASKQNVFEGNYSKDKCIDSCKIKFLMKKCHFIPFMYQKYIDKTWLFNRSKSYNVTANENCYKSNIGKTQKIMKDCDINKCWTGCRYTIYDATKRSTSPAKRRFYIILSSTLSYSLTKTITNY